MSFTYLPKCHSLYRIGWKLMENDVMVISVTVLAKNGNFETNSSSSGHFDSGGIN